MITSHFIWGNAYKPQTDSINKQQERFISLTNNAGYSDSRNPLLLQSCTLKQFRHCVLKNMKMFDHIFNVKIK